MSVAARKIEPVTLEEFQAMDFGDRRAELIGGVVVVGQAFPTSRHGQLIMTLGSQLLSAIDRAGLRCMVETGTGLDVRLETDFSLGPDLMVRCGGDAENPGEPVLVAEVLSPSNTAAEMMQKLRAYQAVETITDILVLMQDRAYVEHWSRSPGEPWAAPERLVDADAVLRVARLDAAIPLNAVYRTPG
ncbi:Uma2 family endonuclease [Azospirillum sp.]|uniref:Uma2 family endonuclease n=1 Tax=Azospirillum sp. TaxID=34012 RepID=UPI002D55D635|nr:Uma2 family endonuclease [Azospirillum sp.]HYD70250.1 Uma2 family endonuclease [Azospirillum sp.]